MATEADHTMEDTVEYRLFPPIPSELSGPASDKFARDCLDDYVAELGKYLVDYIWQNEPFQLRVVSESGGIPAHLYGSTHIGDNVEDEWFILFMIFELTKLHDELVAQVNDNDGEVLLIEAAENLPKWVNPETAENRVFIANGKVHIIPHPKTPTEVAMFPAGVPTLVQSVNCIREHWTSTTAFTKIQNDIERRLQGYPGKAKEFLHRAHCYLPAPLAAVLDHTPSLAAPMVQAFYYRDPIDLKACITFQRFRPGTRVMREVMFTKCLYAQLSQQRFTPDKRSGYTVPPSSSSKFKAYDLGAKLAHGAEILCAKCNDVTPAKPTNIEALSQRDIRWLHFRDSLAEKGYFKGEMEGSKLYQELLDKARKYFYATVSDKVNKAVTAGEQVMRTMAGVDYDLEEMRKEEKSLRSPDDDSWINITPEQLDEMLKAAAHSSASQNGNFDPSVITPNMQKFMSKVSSHEGAEFPKEDDNEIQLDPNSFMQSMQKMFDFDDADSASSSDMDEYGSEDELADTFSPGNKHKSKHSNNMGNKLGVQDYMDLMDRELASTNIGASFEKETTPDMPKAPPRKKKQKKKNNGTTNGVGAANGNPPKATLDDDFGDIDDLDDDDFQPVNVDLNAVKNIMESYSAQQGTAGPAGNILEGMGMRFPPNQDNY